MNLVLRSVLLTLVLLATSPAGAQVPARVQADAPVPSLRQRVEAVLEGAGPGVRFGLVVAREDGTELIAIAPEQRFMPASNSKMLTTAAAFATLANIDAPDADGGASVRLDGAGVPDVVLTGGGDARMSSARDCVVDCLATLADAVAAKVRVVRDVVGDDTLFPDQRWSPGMSWNNIGTQSGTAVSALSVDDNEVPLAVTPAAPGQRPTITATAYFEIENQALTVTAGATGVDFARLPGSRAVRLTGTIAAGAKPVILRLGIDDPAHYAAWRLSALLVERGVRVTGAVAVRHRPPARLDDPALRGDVPPMRPPRPPSLARVVPPPLAEDLVTINKISQNLHAELLLRRIGSVRGTGSLGDGIAAIGAMMERAGVARAGWEQSDGSGMSTYNRLAPRSVVRFLRWTTTQPWGAAWRATFPIGGLDGTLGRRFRGTTLERRMQAKTGTLNATNALSGFMTAGSGRTLIFSVYANDVPDGVRAAQVMDAALELIAGEN